MNPSTTPSPPPVLAPTRETLWQKRLDLEKRLWKRRLPNAEREAHPLDWRGRTLRAVLKALGIWARGVRQALRPRFDRLTLTFPALPRAFDGFRVLHLSDFHLGYQPALDDAIAALLGGIEADLCLMTGDYAVHRHIPAEILRASLERVLGAFTTRHGCYAVLGNNDTHECAALLRTLGVDVLVNECRKFALNGEDLWIAGIDDPGLFACDSIDFALEGVPADAFAILLAHTPERVVEAASRGVALYLTGHTHGGQVCLPMLPPPFINAPLCPRRFAAGPWSHGDLRGYTSRGLGTSALPLRFNCPPEATLLELRRG